MGTLIGLLVARGWSERVARAICYAGLALLLLGAFAGLVAAYNAHIIGKHDAKQNAAVANAVIGADRSAAQQKQARDAAQANSDASIANAVGNAVASNPAAAREPVGPASQAYYDELRRQQRARKGN